MANANVVGLLAGAHRYRYTVYSCIVNVPKQTQQRMAYNLKMYPRDTLHITAMACQVLTWKFPSLHSFPHHKPDKRAPAMVMVMVRMGAGGKTGARYIDTFWAFGLC